MKKTYTLYTDQKNAWLEVSSMDVVYLDIYKKISPFSYFAKYFDRTYDNTIGKIYLEEALDLTLFEQAYKKAFKENPNIKELPYSKPIREFDRFDEKQIIVENNFKLGDFVFCNQFRKRDYVKWKIIKIGKPHHQYLDRYGKHPISIKIKQITTKYHDGSVWDVNNDPNIKNVFNNQIEPYFKLEAKKFWDEAIQRWEANV